MQSAIARYREFVPCEALTPYVRAFFSFTLPPCEPADQAVGRRMTREVVFHAGQPFWSKLFADGHLSIVFSVGAGYRIEGLWHPRPSGPSGHLIGSMSSAQTATHGERLVQVGAYFRASGSAVFTRVPARELANRVIAVEDLWGPGTEEVETAIHQSHGDAERVNRLERALLKRLVPGRDYQGNLNVAGLTKSVLALRGQCRVESLACDAGVSRQHLTRVFRESIGVTPKLYCRLVRFKAALAYAGNSAGTDWARIAVETGYNDQSHMIAEFRQFSSFTPAMLVSQGLFHPFVDRTRAPSPYNRHL